ncbi:ATP-dependent DNA helicase [Alicyclobacillus tolerans]|uniref:ATP-dependent DNA helicase n=1 Tax=Alicyclobacillus tolerans TaxID=90970 RepID=UPI003B7C684E
MSNFNSRYYNTLFYRTRDRKNRVRVAGTKLYNLSWHNPQQRPILTKRLKDRLLGPTIHYNLDRFVTLTTPTIQRQLSPLQQTKNLSKTWKTIFNEIQLIDCPTLEMFKHLKQLTSAYRNISDATWQRRFTKHQQNSANASIFYDTCMSLLILSKSISSKTHAPLNTVFYSLVNDTDRFNQEKTRIQSIHDHNKKILTTTKPHYFGVYEFHQDQQHVHLHLLSNLQPTFYAVHKAVYGAKIVREVQKAFESKKTPHFPFEFIYDIETLKSSDPTQILKYITKTLHYMTKRLAGTENQLPMKKPYIASKNFLDKPQKTSNYNFIGLGPSTLLPPRGIVPLDAAYHENDVIAYANELEKTSRRHDFNVRDFKNTETILQRLLFLESKSLLEEKASTPLHPAISITCTLLQHHTRPIPTPTRSSMIELDPDQQLAISHFCQNPVTILTGSAGAGKTHTVNAMLRLLKLPPDRTWIATQTGILSEKWNQMLAGTPYMAETIHQILQIDHNGNQRFFGDSEVETLIIDEAFSLPLKLLDDLLLAVNTNCRILLIGDPHQLQPFFEDDQPTLFQFLQEASIPIVTLKTNHRSDDPVLTKCQAVLRRDPTPLLSSIIEFNFPTILQAVENGYQLIAATREQVDRWNGYLSNHFSKKLPTVRLGKFEYFVGQKVINLKNDYSSGIFNGSIGQVVEIHPERVTVHFETSQKLTFTPQNCLYLSPAYALTAHKSQGREFEKVLVLLDPNTSTKLTTKEWLYTAITRAKKDVKLSFSNATNQPERELIRFFNSQTAQIDPLDLEFLEWFRGQTN